MSQATQLSLARLGRLGDAEIDAFETALLLSANRRARLRLDPYRRHIVRLAEEVTAQASRRAGPIGLELKAEALRRVLVKQHGYVGDDTGEISAEACDLTRSMDHRRGEPTVLAIIYLATVRAAGWRAEAVAFPVRTLIRLEQDGRRLLLDPFDGGRECTVQDLRSLYKAVAGNQVECRPEDFRDLSGRELTLRLQGHLKAALLRAGDIAAALIEVEACLLFAPEAPSLWREAGLMRGRQGDIAAAIQALEEHLRRETDDSLRRRSKELLGELRHRLGLESR